MIKPTDRIINSDERQLLLAAKIGQLNSNLEKLKKEHDGKVKSILAIPADDWGCGNYRIKQPYYNLASVIPVHVELDFKKSVDNQLLQNFDIVVNQRIIDPKVLEKVQYYSNPPKQHREQYLQMLNNRIDDQQLIQHLYDRNTKKIFINEIDDDLTKVERHNPAYKTYEHSSNTYKTFLKGLRASKYVHTTTNHLKKVYSGLNANTFAFNNGIELRQFNLSSTHSRRHELPTDRIIIGYQGGSSHLKDVPIIVEAVKRILEEYDNVDFAFCSTPEFYRTIFGDELPDHRVHLIPPVTSKFNYFVNLPSMFDIGLAPVLDNEFNMGKSYLKILEYGIWGVPTIASNVNCYQDFDTNGLESAKLVKNKTNSWYSAIKELLDNPDLHLERSKNSFKLVLDQHNVDVKNIDRIKFFREL